MHDDYGMGGLGEIITGEQLKGILLSGFSGGGGMLLAGWGIRKIPVSAGWRGAIAVLSGAVLSRLLWELDEDAAKGFAGGVVGMGISTIVEAVSQGAVSVGLGQPGTRYMNWGMGRTRVDPYMAGRPQLGQERAGPFPGQPAVGPPYGVGQFGRTRVEERSKGQYMLEGLRGRGGFGQDVTTAGFETALV